MTSFRVALTFALAAGIGLGGPFAAGDALAQEYPESPTPPTPPRTTEPGGVGKIWTSTGEPASEELSAQLRAQLAKVRGDAPAIMLNGVLTDREGRTLYVFDADKRGASTCYRMCLQLWPAYLADIDDQPRAGFTLTERVDGGLQWVHEGRPLYYWTRDKKAGDITGDKVNDVWHVVRE